MEFMALRQDVPQSMTLNLENKKHAVFSTYPKTIACQKRCKKAEASRSRYGVCHI